MSACPDPETLARLAAPGDGADADARAAIVDHAATCADCHAVLAMLLDDGSATAATRDDGARRVGASCAPGERIDRYVVVRRLGAGGMGVVYVARDPELGRELAIKMLRRGGAADRLRREAQALARLSHPNVVTVHDVGEHDGQVFVAMELVDGVDLRAWLATPRTVAEKLHVLCGAARGIAAAHAAGLIHRDLKPDNIFVARDGAALVGDFGLARAASDATAAAPAGRSDAPATPARASTAAPGRRADAPASSDDVATGVPPRGTSPDDVVRESPAAAGARSDEASTSAKGPPEPARASDEESTSAKGPPEAARASDLGSDLTATGTVLGTPAYMAPEQAEGRATERSDQYSYCVTAFEALYGARPFRGGSLEEIVEAARRGELVVPPGRHGVPARVEAALRRGLRAEPDERFGSMTELLRELEPRRRRWLYAVSAGGALAAAVTTTVLVARTDSVAPPDAEQLCASGRTFEVVWDPARRTATVDALREQGTPAEAADELARRLDGFADAWTAVRRDTCIAEVTHAITPAVAAARIACLGARTAAFDATARALAAGGTGEVSAAWTRVGALPPPATCTSDDAALLSPATDEHLALVRELARATTSEELGKLEARAEKSSDVAARLAVALAVAGDALDDARLVAADAALARARPLAEKLGAPSARIRAFALSARSLCIQRRDADADRFLELALAGAQRGGEAVADDVFDARHECMFRRGKFAELEPLLVERIAAVHRRYGREGVEEAALRWRLALVYHELGRRTEALAEAGRSQRIQQRYASPSEDAALEVTALGFAAFEKGDLDVAAAHLRRAADMLWMFDNKNVELVLVSLGQLSAMSADPGAASAAYTLAIERISPEAAPPSAITRVQALDGRGEMRLRLGDRERARDDFQQALAAGVRLRLPEIVASAQTGLGLSWVALGEHARAVRVLREGLATYKGRRLGAAQFALAQALWETGERAEAQRLARTAEALVAASIAAMKEDLQHRREVPWSEATLAAIEQWRDTHR